MSKINQKLLIVLVLSFLLLVSPISATVNSPDSEVTVNINYQNLIREDDRLLSTNGQFTLTNPDLLPKTIKINFTELPSGYESSVSELHLAAGETKTVNFNLNIPHLKNSGKEKIGNIQIIDKNTNEVLDTISLFQNTNPMIQIKELEATYVEKEGDSEKDSFNSNSDYKLDREVLPGSEVSLSFKIENLFDENYDQDYSSLEDLELSLKVSDDDLYADEIEETYELTDLDAEKTLLQTITFQVDEDAETKTYEFEIELKAEDGRGALHKINKKLSLDVGRNDDDVRIIKAEVTYSGLNTCSNELQLLVELKNLGTNNQRNVSLNFLNTELGIDKNIAGIEIERYSRDDEYTQTITLPLNKTLTAKTYDLDLTVYNDDQELIEKIIPFTLNICALESNQDLEANLNLGETSQEKEALAEEEEEELEQEKKLISSGIIMSTREDPFYSEEIILGLLIVAVVLILAIVLALLAILIKK